MSVCTWDLEEEVVGHRVAGPSFLDDDSGQEVVVVDGDGSVVVDDQGRPLLRDLLHAVDLVAWSMGQSSDIQTEAHGFCLIGLVCTSTSCSFIEILLW